MVIIGHLFAPSIPHAQGLLSPVFLARNLGPLGVRVFFVISGFLITSLLLRELADTGRLDLPRFYLRRTLRIFPPYYCFVLAMLLVRAVGWVVLAHGDLIHAGGMEWLQRQRLVQRLFASRLFIVIPLLVIAANLINPRMRTGLLSGVTIQNFAIAARIAWCIAHPSGLVGKGLNSRALVFVGIMSYSIYLWQQPFLDPSSPSVVTRFPLNLLLIGIAALASFYLVERPSHAARHWLEARRACRRSCACERRELSGAHDSAIFPRHLAGRSGAEFCWPRFPQPAGKLVPEYG